MGQALYRKYRPKKLDEAVGQSHITDTLKNAIKSGRISHAYLFTGPRGIGKTSVARILAHEINGIPYEDDSIHLDIIEIDAASNRRIDEIRDLRDKVNIAPSSAKYKVYIIDEVHMLTREAFNALLKTLEEPPAHVVFILATTEAYKLPETIISRTQQFNFKPAIAETVIKHLRTIAELENINITDDALEMIAAYGNGSFRDSIGLLDQARGRESEVDRAHMESLLGIPPLEAITELAKDLDDHDAASLIQLLGKLHEQGFQPAQIAKQLGVLCRTRVVETREGSKADFALLRELMNVPSAHDPMRYLEIVLLDYALSGKSTAKAEIKKHKETPPEEKVAQEKQVEKPKPVPKVEKAPVKSEVPTEPIELNEAVWSEILAKIKKKYNTLYGVVRMAQPHFIDDETLELGFKFAFHRKRVSEAKNQEIIAGVIQEISGHSVAIKCVEIAKTASEKPSVPAKVAVLSSDIIEDSEPQSKASLPDTIASISNIFGGGELLES